MTLDALLQAGETIVVRWDPDRLAFKATVNPMLYRSTSGYGHTADEAIQAAVKLFRQSYLRRLS